ncbi:M6 family metalloprotease domain-containing protein [candidate division KSB1 bacterium]
MKFFLYIMITVLLITSGITGETVNCQQVTSYPQGVSAPPYLIDVKQPDGSIIKARLRGDEFYNWVETGDGYTIGKNPLTGIWEYMAPADEGRLRFSARVARRDDPGYLEKHLVDSEKFAQAEQERFNRKTELLRQGYSVKSSPTGTGKTLVILADFADESQAPHITTKTEFEELLLSDGTHVTGSLNDYFQEVSYGNYSVTGKVLEWTTAPETYSYYENGNSGTGLWPNNSQKLVYDLVNLIDAQVDFSQYDGDGDGSVDGITIVYEGEWVTGSFWPHKWNLNENRIRLDGVWIDAYTVVNEQSGGSINGIGTFCHEWGHILGLPDLYDSVNDPETSEGIGYWGLMSSGNWNSPDHPAHFCAWSKIQLGWVTPTVLSENTTNVSIPAVNTTSTVYKLWYNGEPNNEYFLLENRQALGSDQDIMGTGLLVWHIDDDQTDNGDKTHKMVDLEEADGLGDLDNILNRGDDGDPFPGSTNNTAFNFNTTPGNSAYNSYDSQVRIENITESSQTVTADLYIVNEAPGQAIISLSDGETAELESDTLFISVDYDYGFSGLQFDVFFDSTLLSLDGVFKTGRAAALDMTQNIESDQARIILYSMSGDTAAAGSGDVIGLIFTAHEYAADTASINLSDVLLSDVNNDPVDVQSTDGYIVVSNINEPPVVVTTASFTVSPDSGTVNTTFHFDASGSTGDSLTYRWDFDSDGTWDSPASGYSALDTVSYKYDSVGTYTIILEVKNGDGAAASTTDSVVVAVSDIIVLATWDIDLPQGWSMVSPGLNFSDMSLTGIFPNAISAFEFDGQYLQSHNLAAGIGCWINLSASYTAVKTDEPIDELVFTLSNGWQMLGMISENISVGSIIQNPANSIVSIFGFDGGYQAVTDSLKQGEGYWINLSQAATLTLSSASLAKSEIAAYENRYDLDIPLIIETEKGVQTLHFYPHDQEVVDNSCFELPPVAPGKNMDVRINEPGTNGLHSIVFDKSSNSDFTISLSLPSDIQQLDLKWNKEIIDPGFLILTDGIGGVLFSDIDMGLEDHIDLSGKSVSMVKLVIFGEAAILSDYELMQNYPNPFNPETTIQYELPHATNVTIQIYDMLGKEVNTLLSQQMPAGSHSIIWDGTDYSGNQLSSGIYIYKIQAEDYTAARKMILLK